MQGLCKVLRTPPSAGFPLYKCDCECECCARCSSFVSFSSSSLPHPTLSFFLLERRVKRSQCHVLSSLLDLSSLLPPPIISPGVFLLLIISPGVFCLSSSPLVYFVFHYLPCWCRVSFLSLSPLVVYHPPTHTPHRLLGT